LLDRDLVLYEPNNMMEYLDERLPASTGCCGFTSVARGNHPACLCSVYSVTGGGPGGRDHQSEERLRLAVTQRRRKELRESLTGVAPVFRRDAILHERGVSLVELLYPPLSSGVCPCWVSSSEASQPLQDYMDKNLPA